MRLLGLDIGSLSIKAVEVDSAFGRFDIHDYHEQSRLPGQPVEEAIAELIQKLPKSPDRVITSLKSSQTTLRNLQLPTRDKRAVHSSVSFELEDELPFTSEDLVYDYSILSQAKQGSSVHVAATVKKHLDQFFEMSSNALLNPDVVTSEAWAYHILLKKLAPDSSNESPILLVHLGHQRTVLYLHWRNTPILVKEIQWGGSDLTMAVCQKMELSIDQAEAIKMDQGVIQASHSDFTEGQLTPEQQQLSECLKEASETLVQEIRQVSLAAKSMTRHSVATIYLIGGPSLLPGLPQWLESRFAIQTKLLRSLSGITASGVTYSEQTDAKFALPLALCLSQVGAERANCINFRKGAYSKEAKSRQINFEVLRKPLLAVGIVAASLFASLIIQTAVYESRIRTTNAQLEKSVKNFFGQISNSALKTYMNNTSTLKNSVQKELTRRRQLGRLFGPNPKSPLNGLNQLSKKIPKDVVVDLSQIQIGASGPEPFANIEQKATLSMTFLVANPQVTEKLANLIEPQIQEVQRSKTEEFISPDGTNKKWKTTFSGTPKEDFYGR